MGLKYIDNEELKKIEQLVEGRVSCFNCTLLIESAVFAIKHDC